MTRNQIILTVGVLIVIMPFLGFPRLWKTIFYMVSGGGLVLTAVIAHVERRAATIVAEEAEETEVFVENNAGTAGSV